MTEQRSNLFGKDQFFFFFFFFFFFLRAYGDMCVFFGVGSKLSSIGFFCSRQTLPCFFGLCVKIARPCLTYYYSDSVASHIRIHSFTYYYIYIHVHIYICIVHTYTLSEVAPQLLQLHMYVQYVLLLCPLYEVLCRGKATFSFLFFFLFFSLVTPFFLELMDGRA